MLMASIHGAAFVVVGAVVAIVSYMVEMWLFLFLGLGFVVWGAGKLLLKKKHAKRHVHHRPHHHVPHQRCPACSAVIKPGANFCWNCGQRLRYH